MTPEEIVERFKLLGLNEQKAKETLKNANVSKVLLAALDEVSNPSNLKNIINSNKNIIHKGILREFSYLLGPIAVASTWCRHFDLPSSYQNQTSNYEQVKLYLPIYCIRKTGFNVASRRSIGLPSWQY